jgi:hypothetical protein
MLIQDHIFIIRQYCLLYYKINCMHNTLSFVNAWNLEKEEHRRQ